MADNDTSVSGSNLKRKITAEVILIQVLVTVFVSINIMLIATFFIKEVFYTTMRYIFFAQTLLSDCVILIVTNVLLILLFFRVVVPMPVCVVMVILTSECKFVTPLTLTAMALERYVAICMPLRHAELCSARGALRIILIIHGLSIIPIAVILLIFFVTATFNVVTNQHICRMEAFLLHQWQEHLSLAFDQFYFLVMLIAIFFSYVRIMKAARAASGENKSSSRKGLRTVVLHTFQLLLCLIQLWCPMIEAAVFKINLILYINIRYMNYVLFYLASRCLSPLIYGLRDDKFFHALKHFILCGAFKNKSLQL